MKLAWHPLQAVRSCEMSSLNSLPRFLRLASKASLEASAAR